LEGIKDGPCVQERVLVVDLDRTLLRVDTLWEQLLSYLHSSPASVLLLVYWLLQGRARLKHELGRRCELNPELLPYREEVLELVRRERAGGRRVVLATGADRSVAERIAAHLGLFSGVLASEEGRNLKGEAKLMAILSYLGEEEEFDYIGDSDADLPVWQVSGRAMVVSPTVRLLRKIKRERGSRGKVSVVGRRGGRWQSLVRLARAMRVHQWVKNVLIFVPFVLSHARPNLGDVLVLASAWFSFGLCASAIYIVNDLLDISSDRQHPRKRSRPFASGELGIPAGLLLSAGSLGGSVCLVVGFLPLSYLGLLGLYGFTSLMYSIRLKRMLLVDVITLALLYTLRIFAGGYVLEIPISNWLLAFSLFFFFSLALLKRYSELYHVGQKIQGYNNRRNYKREDLNLLQILGVSSGLLSILVLVLYLQSDVVVQNYTHPRLLWLIAPPLLYWINRLWFLTERGYMRDDPIVFSVKDWMSYLVSLVILTIFIISSI